MEQRFYNGPKAFCLLLGVTIFVYIGCIGPYSTGTITTLQRQFQYKSTEIGVLLSVNDITGIVMVTLTAYYGVSRHRPRILGCFTLLFAVACVISAIPQFVDDVSNRSLAAWSNSSSPKEYICDVTTNPEENEEDECSKEEQNEAGAQHLKALWLYIGQALFGIAASGYWSLGISYLDDGVSRKSSPVYIASVFMVSSLGSFLGFALSAFSLTFHADFYQIDVDQLGYDDKDPRWIGAWWLGYLIYAGIFVVISIPYFFFPKVWPKKNIEEDWTELKSKPSTNDDTSSISHRECQTDITGEVDEVGVVVSTGDDVSYAKMGYHKKQNGGQVIEEKTTGYEKLDKECEGELHDDDEGESVGSEKTVTCSLSLITGYLLSLVRLFTNVTYMAIVFGIVSQSANISGFYIFIGRYLQTHYDITPANVSVILSAVTTPTSFFGVLLSGVIVNRMNLTSKGLMNMTVICKVLATVFIAGNFFLPCDKAPIAGVNTPYFTGESSLEPLPTCISSCGCGDGVYTPVCGSDGLTYITPCHAGCTEVQENEDGESFYLNCTCIPLSSTSDPTLESYSTTVKNQCPRNCRTQITIFIVLYCIYSFIQSTMGNASFLAKIRIVEKRDKALSIAFSNLLQKVLAFIPAPIYYGLAIQSTCVLFQESCGKTGNCLIYDTDLLRIRFWGMVTGLSVSTILCFVVGCLTIRHDADGKYVPLTLRIVRTKKEKSTV